MTKDDIVHVGQPYGALHQELAGKQLSPTMEFTIGPEYAGEVQPWLELVRTGTFSAATLANGEIPLSYMTSAKWEKLLEASVAKHGETYLHLHHLGVIAAERLNIPLATARLRRSVALRPTAVAHRNLAALLTDPAEMAEHFTAAWTLALGYGPNASTTATTLQGRLQYDLAGDFAIFLTSASVLVEHGHLPGVAALWPQLEALLAELPSVPGCAGRGPYCDHDGIAMAAMLLGHAEADVPGCSQALRVLKTWPLTDDNGANFVFSRNPYCQPQFSPASSSKDHGNEAASSSVWGDCTVVLAEAAAGRKLSPAGQNTALAANPPPYWLGFALS